MTATVIDNRLYHYVNGFHIAALLCHRILTLIRLYYYGPLGVPNGDRQRRSS